MRSDAMTVLHQQDNTPWEWPLRSASATRLPASNLPRWLTVSSGRVWLTQSGAGPDADDVWLAAGERHALPAGSEWVIEGWPEARVTVLEAPVRRLSARAASRFSWLALRPGLLAA